MNSFRMTNNENIGHEEWSAISYIAVIMILYKDSLTQMLKKKIPMKYSEFRVW